MYSAITLYRCTLIKQPSHCNKPSTIPTVCMDQRNTLQQKDLHSLPTNKLRRIRSPKASVLIALIFPNMHPAHQESGLLLLLLLLLNQMPLPKKGGCQASQSQQLQLLQMFCLLLFYPTLHLLSAGWKHSTTLLLSLSEKSALALGAAPLSDC